MTIQEKNNYLFVFVVGLFLMLTITGCDVKVKNSFNEKFVPDGTIYISSRQEGNFGEFSRPVFTVRGQDDGLMALKIMHDPYAKAPFDDKMVIDCSSFERFEVHVQYRDGSHLIIADLCYKQEVRP